MDNEENKILEIALLQQAAMEELILLYGKLLSELGQYRNIENEEKILEGIKDKTDMEVE